MRTVTVDSVNEAVRRDAGALIREADDAYRKRLEQVATTIRDHRQERPIILLSGPSGSGKTTTAQIIESILDRWGVETHTLSLDDYFRPIEGEEKELLASGKLDLESPDRVDAPFLNRQLQSILDCEPTPIPRFRFTDNSRQDSGWLLTRKPGELVILEGTHAFNPNVITLPDDFTTRLYISVRSRLAYADGELFHPSGVRLMRRLMRDQLFRGRTAPETWQMFDSVQQGEERYIMPYKHRASIEIDTFFSYEVSAYRPLLLPVLKNYPDLPGVETMIRVLEQVEPIDEDHIGADALIREFIGPVKEKKKKAGT